MKFSSIKRCKICNNQYDYLANAFILNVVTSRYIKENKCNIATSNIVKSFPNTNFKWCFCVNKEKEEYFEKFKK